MCEIDISVSVYTVTSPQSMLASFLSLESGTATATTAVTLTREWLQWRRRDEHYFWFFSNLANTTGSDDFLKLAPLKHHNPFVSGE